MKQGIARGALILTISGIGVKVLGALFKIPLGAMLGPEGNGIFSVAYNIYALLFTVATAGLPVATSKIVAEVKARGKSGEQVLKKAILPFGATGLALSAALTLFSTQISRALGIYDARFALIAIAPAIFLVSIAALLRGYFQGLGNMTPTGVSQFIEALFKLVLGIICAKAALKITGKVHFAAAGAVLGVTVGALFSLIYLLFKKRGCREEGGSDTKIVARLFKTALPITLGASVVSLGTVIDSALIMRLLPTGEEEALWLFGAYNYAATVFNLPSILISTLGISLVPTVTATYVLKRFKETSRIAERSIKISLAVAMGAGCGLFALGSQVLAFIYQGVEKEAIACGGEILKILALSVAPLGLTTVTNALLQAMGDTRTPMYSMMIGTALKVFLNCVLIGRMGIGGAAWATFASYICICGINFIALKRRKELSIKILGIMFAPCVCGGVTGMGAKLAYFAFSTKIGNNFSLIIAIGCGVLLWTVCIMLCKIVGLVDIKRLFYQKRLTIFAKNIKKIKKL